MLELRMFVWPKLHLMLKHIFKKLHHLMKRSLMKMMITMEENSKMIMKWPNGRFEV